MEVALKIKAKNAVLQRFIDKKGWSQNEFARQLGTAPSVVGKWFNLKSYPGPMYMKKVCELVGETDEIIFPKLMRKKDFMEMDKSVTYYKQINPDRILEGKGLEELPAPEDSEYQESLNEAMENLHEVIEHLSYKERICLIRTYGLDGLPPSTNTELAKRLQISRSRVGQIIGRAVRKLQNPIFSKKLEGYLSKAKRF